MLLDKGAQMRPPVQPTVTPAQRQSVVVVGGGFAGLNLIQHLCDAPVNIVLVPGGIPLTMTLTTAILAPAQIVNGDASMPAIGAEVVQ
jgi:hypothetical protein